MVALATRIALGATLAELGWSGGLLAERPFVAVKAPVFSTARLRGVDPSLGPAMQSTGEVIGIHEDGRAALAKALLAASLRPPLPDERGRLALLSIADRDKGRLGDLASALIAVGYELAATRGTAEALRRLGHRVIAVGRLGEPPTVGPTLDGAIRSGEVRLIVNTPSPSPGAVRDAAAIRSLAIDEGILCLTSIETAVAAASSLDPEVRALTADVRPLGEWLAPDTNAEVRVAAAPGVRAQEPGRVGQESRVSFHR
jgi:carbamoyl-phosphate synthase large subunit